ncbi:ATPase family associated with various cellular activities (AAA) [Belliella buryatensis]|uniref:ATPase family associated with various cellular activities (AAA) n=1 Tax=Belliella buryatensis TaxID=1500549 RepID=A0A239GNC1_9BACT|nr:AAA family ATPase [Belliella buryatensis]SNS70699.1 ATPase family associated with various cellular activities (AAA) [Belliella buryatensis]
MNSFIKNTTPEYALYKGARKRRLFLSRVESVVKISSSQKYRHLYLYSPPGLGKTFSVKHVLNNLKINHLELTGNTSMYAFGIMLAVIQYRNPNLIPLTIFVDDSDELFRTEPSCNAMKNVLEGANKFTYEKSMANTEGDLTELQLEAVKFFRHEGRSGFEVPTHNLKFIFTSNNRLPLDEEVEKARKKGAAKSPLIVHRNAIRSRCRVLDFDLSKTEHWGWLADVALNTNCLSELGIDEKSTNEILMYVWENWDHLKERSIRVVEKMGLTILEQPHNYEKYWRMDFLQVA